MPREQLARRDNKDRLDPLEFRDCLDRPEQLDRQEEVEPLEIREPAAEPERQEPQV